MDDRHIALLCREAREYGWIIRSTGNPILLSAPHALLQPAETWIKLLNLGPAAWEAVAYRRTDRRQFTHVDFAQVRAFLRDHGKVST